MKDKIFQLLKQEYKSLGLGDEVLQAHAEMLDKMGLVTDDNIETVVASQNRTPYITKNAKYPHGHLTLVE